MFDLHPHMAVRFAAGASETASEGVSAPLPVPRLVASPVVMLLVAVLAAFAGWFLLPRFENVFLATGKLADDLHAMSGVAGQPVPLPPESVAALQRLMRSNAMVAFAVLGAAFGAIAGTVEGSLRRSVGTIALGLVGGAVLGAAFGAAGGFVASLVYEQPLPQLIRLAKTMSVQAATWSVFAIGIGAALALPSRSLRIVGLTISGAVVGGLLAAVLYCFIWPILLPNHSTERLIPETSDHRLYWMLLAFVLIGMVAAWQGRSQPRPPRTQAAS